MPAMDDSSTQHVLWPDCQMHFIVETRATKSGIWFPLVDMAVGDYIELVEEEELRAGRQAVNNWHRAHSVRFAIRTDRASPATHILRRIK